MARIAALVLALTLFCASPTQAGDVELLFFTSPTCGPCQQMKPLVAQLVNQGFPIRTVDVQQQPGWAQEFSVSSVPMFVMMSDGQVVGRQVGKMPMTALHEMFRQSGWHTQGRNDVVESSELVSQRGSRGYNDDRSYTATRQDVRQVSSQNPAVERAMRATVRLRVEDPQGTGVGTGTIVHSRNGEALVLTCGHLFRESQGRGAIEVEYGFPGPTRIVSGKLLGYDADAHDTALVVIQVEGPVEIVPIALGSYKPMEQDSVFSIGCDRGDDPSVRTSKVKALTYYSNVLKYDVFGRPIDGRSGGGLFTAGGQLIGICNAAAVEEDEGLYAGIPSIHTQLDAVGLGEIFNDQQLFEDSLRTQGVAQLDRSRTMQQTPDRLTHDNSRRELQTTPSIDSNTVVYGDSREETPTGSMSGDFEVIMVIRSKTDPTRTESIVIDQPSHELLQSARRESRRQAPATSSNVRSSQTGRALLRNQNRLPEATARMQPPSDGPTYRAQSRR